MITMSFFINGASANSWARAIAYDYVFVKNIHITNPTEQTAIYDCIVSKMVDGSYYHTTFGPLGQNKIVADFFFVLKTNGNIVSRLNTKTGSAPRWDCDGTIFNQGNLPNYTKGTNDGWIIYSSIDALSTITRLDLDTNQFSGTLPNIPLQNCTQLWLYSNQFSGTFPTINLQNCAGFFIYSNQFSGTFPTINMPLCTGFYIYSNQFSGVFPNINLSSCTNYQINNNAFSSTHNLILNSAVKFMFNNVNDFDSSLIYANKDTTVINYQSNNFTTTAINEWWHNQYLALVGKVPTSNCAYTFNGTGMAAPTGGHSNPDIVAISNIYSAAGKIFTYFINL